MTSSSINKKDNSYKSIAFLLVIAIVASVVGNSYTALTNEKLLRSQEDEFENLIEHRTADRQHINATATTLQQLNDFIRREIGRDENVTGPIIEQFKVLAKTTEENNVMLKELTKNKTGSNSSNSSSSTNASSSIQ